VPAPGAGHLPRPCKYSTEAPVTDRPDRPCAAAVRLKKAAVYADFDPSSTPFGRAASENHKFNGRLRVLPCAANLQQNLPYRLKWLLVSDAFTKPMGGVIRRTAFFAVLQQIISHRDLLLGRDPRPATIR
jgi:hypothetical protein